MVPPSEARWRDTAFYRPRRRCRRAYSVNAHRRLIFFAIPAARSAPVCRSGKAPPGMPAAIHSGGRVIGQGVGGNCPGGNGQRGWRRIFDFHGSILLFSYFRAISPQSFPNHVARCGPDRHALFVADDQAVLNPRHGIRLERLGRIAPAQNRRFSSGPGLNHVLQRCCAPSRCRPAGYQALPDQLWCNGS